MEELMRKTHQVCKMFEITNILSILPSRHTNCFRFVSYYYPFLYELILRCPFLLLQGLSPTPSRPGNGTIEGGLELPSPEV